VKELCLDASLVNDQELVQDAMSWAYENAPSDFDYSFLNSLEHQVFKKGIELTAAQKAGIRNIYKFDRKEDDFEWSLEF
jgi:hypothetical protein